MKHLVALFLCFVHILGFAQIVETPIVQPPTRGLKMAPLNYDHNLLTPGTSGYLNTEDWYVAQWQNSHPMGAFNGSNTAQSLSSRVVYAPNNIELALNSNFTICNPDSPVEANLFVSPNSIGNPSTYNTPPYTNSFNSFVGYNPPNTYLSGSSKLIHTLSVKILYWQQVAYPANCVTQNYFITSFVLKNKKDLRYTFFYQLSLAEMPVTPARPQVKGWFWRGGPDGFLWGYDDNLSTFNQVSPKYVGQTVNFNADMKPVFIKIVTDPNSNLPANLRTASDWYVESLYYGPHSWGGALSTYQVSNFSFKYSRYCVNLNPNNCVK